MTTTCSICGRELNALRVDVVAAQLSEMAERWRANWGDDEGMLEWAAALDDIAAYLRGSDT